MQEISLEQFNEILKKDSLTVLMCSAVWCSACRAVSPICEQVSDDLQFDSLYKVDVDKTPDIATTYGISSIPTLLFIKDGKLVDKHVGVITRTPLKNKIESYL